MAAVYQTGPKVMQTMPLSHVSTILITAFVCLVCANPAGRIWNSGLTDLEEEAIEGERVLPQQDPASITQDLGNAANHHERPEGEGPIFQPLRGVYDHGNAKEDEEDDIGRDARPVLVDACGDWA